MNTSPQCILFGRWPAIVLVLWLWIAGSSHAASPNIVLFLADDLGWADVPWHGSKYSLPVLESLARESLLLEAHYVHPMCSPTRAALLSGRYASRFGVVAAQNQRAYPFNTVTLADALGRAGYDTALIGKWHLGSKPDWGPNLFGFDHAYGSLAGGVTPDTHLYKKGEFSRTWHRNGELIDEPGHVTDLLCQEAVSWIRERSREKPFFLYLPFTAIHVPIAEDPRWLQQNAHLTDPAQQLRAACTSHMDHVIGQVLNAVDALGVRENTLVIFLSDNGAHGPSDNQGGPYPGNYGSLKVGNDNTPLRGHKSSVWEGGIRTPGLVNWKGRVPVGQTAAPLHAVDWMPTLCALAGVQFEQDLNWDGLNIWPVLSGQDRSPAPRTIYSAGVGFKSAAIRHGDWKLIVSDGSGKNMPQEREQLFNLQADLSETRNLAAEQPVILQEMRTRLQAVQQRDRESVAKDDE